MTAFAGDPQPWLRFHHNALLGTRARQWATEPHGGELQGEAPSRAPLRATMATAPLDPPAELEHSARNQQWARSTAAQQRQAQPPQAAAAAAAAALPSALHTADSNSAAVDDVAGSFAYSYSPLRPRARARPWASANQITPLQASPGPPQLKCSTTQLHLDTPPRASCAVHAARAQRCPSVCPPPAVSALRATRAPAASAISAPQVRDEEGDTFHFSYFPSPAAKRGPSILQRTLGALTPTRTLPRASDAVDAGTATPRAEGAAYQFSYGRGTSSSVFSTPGKVQQKVRQSAPVIGSSSSPDTDRKGVDGGQKKKMREAW